MKKPELSRRHFIKASIATVAAIALGDSALLLSGCHPATQPTPQPTTTPPTTKVPTTTVPTQRRFLIPAILNSTNRDPRRADFELVAQKGETDFFSGKHTETFGYNGSYLGPTLRVNRGQEVNIKLKNQLNEIITTHWHGGLVPGEMDGGCHQTIPAGGEWNPHFTIEQPAATLWYHTHTMGETGRQVNKGLAGLFIIDDEVSQNLNIPKDYGINDIPLIIQDRRFAQDGSLLYMSEPNDVTGMRGDTILVNGFVNAALDVSTIKMRFRILNGSNARIYTLSLSDGGSFTQIASDGGFLESPVKLDTMRLAPGERAEIIIDFSKYSVGDIITLRSQSINIMDFSVVKAAKDTTTIPEKLTTINKIPESTAVRTRKFVLGGMGPTSNINDQQMNMHTAICGPEILQMDNPTGKYKIHESVKMGDTEIWEITAGASSGMSHPFHVHGLHFQVLDINGSPPPAGEQGWKDTVFVETTKTARIIGTFKYKGIFMFHCHILEHEDAGQMLQYKCA